MLSRKLHPARSNSVPSGPCQLLMHMNDLTDSSPYNRSVSQQNVTFTAGYALFNGNSYLQPAGIPALGTDDFTIDGKFYITNTGDRALFGSTTSNSGGICVFQDQSGQRRIYHGVTLILAIPGNFPTNVWTHIALVRHSGTVYLFQDGVLIGSVYYPNNFTSDQFRIGWSLYNNFVGRVDEFRYMKGVAAWTANFEPPKYDYQ